MSALHLVGNAHLDPAWLWRWQEGFAEIKATFRSALDRMEEFPDFTFTCAGAAHYAWVEENAPEMFEEIRRRVREGRWALAGGWWVQPDCNLPCGESFVRQGLYGQRYFADKFGKRVGFGYNVDSFGHAASLPQILVKSGMDGYVFARPDSSEKDLPASLFWWESADGSRLLAYRIPFGYQTGIDARELVGKVDAVEELADAEGAPQMLFYGVGDHGGGPTVAMLRAVEELRKAGREIRYSSPREYFAEMKEDAKDLPVVRDELQHHGSGCYSTTADLKADNRRAENRLLSAEKWLVVARRVLGLRYDRAPLTEAWKSLLFNQFHDILAGTCIPEACQDAHELFGYSLKTAAEALNAALQKISWSIDTLGNERRLTGKERDWILWQGARGAPLVVFNPLSWEVAAAVEVPKQLKGVTDANGAPLPLQDVRASRTNGTDCLNSIFMARVPALGYRVYWGHLDKQTRAAGQEHSLESGAAWLENDWTRLEVDANTGWISRLYDKTAGRDVLGGPGAVPIVVDDTEHDTWAHGFFEFRDEIGRFKKAAVRLIEAGPLRASLRVESDFGRSRLRQDFTLHRDRKGVDVKVRLDWQEQHQILKLSFPVSVVSARATYEIPYGTIARPVDGRENPGQSWVDVSGMDGSGKEAGLTLANTAKYGYDVLGADLRLTVARSALYADHFGERDGEGEFMDQGVQVFAYRLLPHAGDWREAGAPRAAMELNNPPVLVLETSHKGTLPLEGSFIEISAPNVAATALKDAEEGDAVVLRCFETDGVETEAVISLPFLSARWKTRFGKNEIKTFKIGPDGRAREANLLEDEGP
jgi:alpha-mannosidase